MHRSTCWLRLRAYTEFLPEEGAEEKYFEYEHEGRTHRVLNFHKEIIDYRNQAQSPNNTDSQEGEKAQRERKKNMAMDRGMMDFFVNTKKKWCAKFITRWTESSSIPRQDECNL